MSNLIIFDWDDTLFPTTWAVLNKMNMNLASQYIGQMSELDNVIFNVLTNSLKYGKVIIVTNAMNEWIDLCCESLPKTNQIISKSIKVISARQLVQESYPNDPYKWKEITFSKLFGNYDTNNIISFGDADYEYKALLNLTKIKKKSKCYFKSIKLLHAPDNIVLVDQLKVINKTIKSIILRETHLELIFKSS